MNVSSFHTRELNMSGDIINSLKDTVGTVGHGTASQKIIGVCLRPHGRSENFINASFIIRNTTFLFYIYKVITFTIYIIIIVHKLLW